MTVETYKGQKLSLAEKTEDESVQELNEAKVQEILPRLKTKLRELIAAKVPAPEVVKPGSKVGQLVKEVVTHLVSPEDVGYRINGKPLDTQLVATIPLEEGATISTIISATGYPGVTAEDLDYTVSVEGLNGNLVIAGSKATIESKARSWDRSGFSFANPLESTSPSWPVWSRTASPEELQEYLERLNFDQKGVTFRGSTTPIIKKD